MVTALNRCQEEHVDACFMAFNMAGGLCEVMMSLLFFLLDPLI